MTAPTLAWLTEHYPPARGGMSQSCDRIVGGLRRAGIRVDLLHLETRPRPWEERLQQGGRYLAVPLDSDPAHALNRLWTRLRGLGQDYSHLVAFGGRLPLSAGPVFAAWLGRPLVTLLRGNDFDTAVLDPRRAPALHAALAASARVCCVSREQVHKVQALHPGLPVHWVPNGIDGTAWAAQPFDLERAREWRRRFVPEGRLVLGLYGHLKAKKGLLFLLETLLRAGLAERFHLLLVGDLTAEAVQWLEARQERFSATLLPFLDRYDLIPYLCAADYAVLPSFYDGMPNLMLEAMALGLPLLAARTGGMADLLRDGEHALLFEPGDPHGCRHALLRAAAGDAAQRRAMGEAGAALVRQRLGADRETAAYLEVFGAANPN